MKLQHPANPLVAVTIGPGNTYSPSTATVAPGGTVTWTNAGGDHKVTSN